MTSSAAGRSVSVLARRHGWFPHSWFPHSWFLGVLGLGAALRIVTMLGYRPALWFPDSYTYVVTAMRPRPDLVRPAGYSMFLRLFEPFHSFALVTFVQHLLGLLAGAMIYVTVLRWCGRSRRSVLVAAAATVPVLLDAYQIEMEHLLVSDSLFTFLVVAAACLALRRPPSTHRPSTPAAVALGLILAAATLTRTIGLPLIAVFAFFLVWYGFSRARVVRRDVPRRVGAFALAALLPLAAYAGWFYAAHHRVGLVGSNGVFLYGRTMTFADCSVMRPPADVAVLCDSRPPAERPTSQDYIWSDDSPLVRLPGITFIEETDALAGRFAWLAIRSQPLDYSAGVLTELGRTFTWRRHVYPDAETYGYYEFPASTPAPPDRHPAIVGKEFAERYERGSVAVRIAEPYAGWMRAYQRVASLPGALLLVVLVIPLLRLVRPARRGAARGSGVPWGLPWATAWVLLVVPAATAQFDYRYVLPATPLACLAAALAMSPDDRRDQRIR
ncbi:hypothetical protein [Sphaerimonospora thailandensis]|uniref:hypothetical protein n=1 Tax=Sphaerimonospora thailandensis TaxID=795644 RepID=UPI001EF3A2D1|nr:hypothetical protein [Sphaerimonospora thailandensis]